MSWLFGIHRNSQPPQDFTQFVPTGDGGGDGSPPKIGGSMDTYKFDSSALERAAAAAKDLERSSTVTLSRRFHALSAESRARGYVSG